MVSLTYTSYLLLSPLLILLLLLLGGHLNSGDDGKALLLSMASDALKRTANSDDKALVGLFVSSSSGEVVLLIDHKDLMICVLVDGEKPIISPSITLPGGEFII